MSTPIGLIEEMKISRSCLFSRLAIYLDAVKRGEPRTKVLTETYNIISKNERIFLIGIAFEALNKDMDVLKSETKEE